MTKLIDICFNATHNSFTKDLDAVIAAAHKENVERMIVPGSSLSDSHRVVQLCGKYPNNFRAAIGIHPHLAKEWNEESSVQLHTLAQDSTVVAIGETGLDYNRNYSEPNIQRLVFEHHLELAVQTKLPLFLHQRDAHQDFLAQLTPYRNELTNAVVHCFTGNEQELNDYLELDLYIGITGWICDEPRGKHLTEIVSKIPASRLMLETDAPYLLPKTLSRQPSKRRNEPKFLAHIAQQVAVFLDMDVSELAAQTTTNAQRFFGWSEEC